MARVTVCVCSVCASVFMTVAKLSLAFPDATYLVLSQHLLMDARLIVR